MASSKEAFEKFVRWKNSRTVLKFTFVTKGGMPETLVGQIMGTEEDSFLVFFGVRETRELRLIDFGDATFRIGKLLLEAERSTGDWLTFEEMG